MLHFYVEINHYEAYLMEIEANLKNQIVNLRLETDFLQTRQISYLLGWKILQDANTSDQK